jgi:hypothetical protein
MAAKTRGRYFKRKCTNKSTSQLLHKVWLLNSARSNPPPTNITHWADRAAPGVDVMITIFCDFLTIFGKKLAFFSKNQCYDQNFAYFSFVLSQKHQFFCRIFRRKYFKNHNIGPWNSAFGAHYCIIILPHFLMMLCSVPSRCCTYVPRGRFLKLVQVDTFSSSILENK